ncbi:autotransporter outer membrane beta-barrel domain-containing protein [Xenorhabdus innexi]|nr:autotransporter outer membrane beta-barrel domain-containing protein [Xenorhabdus innexi]
MGQPSGNDAYGLKYSAVNIGVNNNQASVISVDNIKNSGTLDGMSGITVTYSGSVENLLNYGTISGTNGTVWVSGQMTKLENHGSINSSNNLSSLNAIQIQPASKSDDNSQYGRVDTILNQETGSIDGISVGSSTLKLLHNLGTLKSQDKNALSNLATFSIDAGSNIGTFSNSGTLLGPYHGVLVQNGGYLENLYNNAGKKINITAEQNAVQVTGEGKALLDANPHIRPSRIKQITNASLLYGKQSGISIDDKGTVDTITNLDGAVIKGDKFSIKNSGTITNGIHNSGEIDGDIELGSATLYISGPKATLNGKVYGAKNSIVTIGGKGTSTENSDLTYTHDMSVDSVRILSGSVLRLGDGHKTGNIANDINNAGDLYFNPSDKVTYSHIISGTGSVHQAGNGITTLTGLNTYTGATSVKGGTLIVNGQLGTTASTFDVKNGGTVDGTGLIKSTTTIENGGRLVGHQDNTLTFGNDLIFSSDSNVDISLGSENESIPSLFDVKGNLTLAGTLNVTDLGGFSAGEYDIFSYHGKLTDNGMTLLTNGKPGSLSLNTYKDNKISLINTAGIRLNYWDGGNPSKHNNDAIDGGDGIWQVGGQNNWTLKSGNLTGERNSSWNNNIDQFAIFSGKAGKVQVDNGTDHVTVNGIQFSTNGYTISGNPITLKNDLTGSAKIRVGTGKKSATDMVATIESDLTGSAKLETTDYGKLVLTGKNNYTGGTKITRGILQLGDGSTKGSIYGDVTTESEGTIIFDRSGNVTFSGNISGKGKLVQNGEGILALTGTDTHTGITEVRKGILRQGTENTFSSASPYTIGQHGTLDMGGFNTVISALNNSGNVLMGGDNKTVGHTLTIANNYNGNNGTVALSTALGGDDSKTDKLVIKGNTSGSTHLVIKNTEGNGALTNEGIKVVDVKGVSDAVFTLVGDYSYKGEPAVVAGAYAYRLYKNGTDNSDGNWYLRSSLTSSKPNPEPNPTPNPNPNPVPAGFYQAGVSVYEAYGRVLQTLNEPDSLRDRVGGYDNKLHSANRPRNANDEDNTNDSRSSIPNGVWERITIPSLSA